MSGTYDAIELPMSSECCSVNVDIQRAYLNHDTATCWLDGSTRTNDKALERIRSLSVEEVTNQLFRLVLYENRASRSPYFPPTLGTKVKAKEASRF